MVVNLEQNKFFGQNTEFVLWKQLVYYLNFNHCQNVNW